MQVQIFDKLEQIQIVLEYNGLNYIGLFGLGDLPNQMELNKFEKFFTKCYSKELNYCIEYELKGDNLELKLIASLDFFSIEHKLKFVKSSFNPNITQELIKNIVIDLENKLEKTITLVDLRSFEPINLSNENDSLYNSSKHKKEFDLSEQIKTNKTNLLIGYKSSETKLDLSAYPYELVQLTQLTNFFNLEELILNGQSEYKFYSADSNQIDTSIFIKDVISIGTINPTVKKVTIDNIYKIEGGLGYMDWAPELQELTLIGFEKSIEILKYIARNTKLKKINLINCVFSISTNPEPIYSYVYSSAIKELDTSEQNNFIKLVQWCKSKSIEINEIEYKDDENKPQNINYRMSHMEHMEQMTSMDPSGYKEWSKFESIPKILSNSSKSANIDGLESNDTKFGRFGSFAPF